jgi:hypothetical protein
MASGSLISGLTGRRLNSLDAPRITRFHSCSITPKSLPDDQVFDGCAAIGWQKPNFAYQTGESAVHGKYLVNSLSISLRFLQIGGKHCQKTEFRGVFWP